jgi:hypothetical protein
LYGDTNVLEEHAAPIFRVKVRNWFTYIGMLQGRWSFRPTGQGKEKKPALLLGIVAR